MGLEGLVGLELLNDLRELMGLEGLVGLELVNVII